MYAIYVYVICRNIICMYVFMYLLFSYVKSVFFSPLSPFLLYYPKYTYVPIFHSLQHCTPILDQNSPSLFSPVPPAYIHLPPLR